MQLNEKTSVPIGWVITLLMGCATFTAGAVKVGQYLGGNDANAVALTLRVDKLEEAVKKIPEIAAGVARIEGAMGTNPSERKPANK